MQTIGQVISRVRNLIKGVRHDAFLTDRFIFSVISKHAKWLMKREDRDNKLMAFPSIFKSLDYIEMIEIDRVEARCTGIKSGIKFMRTKHKLPLFMEGYFGPLIRVVSSLDGATELQPLSSGADFQKIAKSKNYKYNKTLYYWFLDGHLYAPNISWEAIRMEAVPELSITKFKCPDNCKDDCKTRQEEPFNVPEYLHAEMESNVLKDLGMMIQVPPDLIHDNQNILK